jgi:protein O-GlcNAc transferase
MVGCATVAGFPPVARPSPSLAIGASVESSDRRLAAALLADSLIPSAEADLGVAREYARLGILDMAHTRTARALVRRPSFADAHEMMGRIWRDWGQPEVGLPHAHRAIFYAPESASAQNTLGTILDALGRPDAAREAFRRALALDPSAGWALSNLCYLEFRLGRFDEARAHCEGALRATPALPEARNNLALAYAGAGDMAGAREAFLGAGDVAAAHYNLGIVYAASGRNDDALREFQAAIEARPDFTAAKVRAHDAKMRAMRATDWKR